MKELAIRNYKDYIVRVHHGVYEQYDHTELICDAIQPIAEGEQKHILVELPPRHSKSMTITETFPSYFIGRNPDKRVISAAYSDGLARKFGRLNRNKVAEFGDDLFGVNIAYEKSAGSNWSVEGTRGGMIATGIGGSITGEGADLLIIDDPIKNAEEAESTTMREKVWAEWESTLSTRLHKGASVIVVMTRWHEDDLIGRLLENSPHDWERIRLPAIAEAEGDLLGRNEGESLCRELGFDEEWARIKKLEVGSRVWGSLYQQNPTPTDGNIFDRNWWKFYDKAPIRFDEIIQSWDLAFKDAKTSDYVVGQVWGRKGSNKYLLDQVRDKMDFPATITAIRTLSRKWPRAKLKLVEDKANGPAVISSLKNEIAGLIPVNPQGGKIVRANAITPDVEAGNVFLPKDAFFTHDFIEEASAFPNGKHDDMVDTMTQALNRFGKRSTAKISNINIW